RARDQLLDRTAAPLGGDRERAVLDEGARVAEIGHVLAGSPLPGRAPPGDGIGARRIPGELLAPHRLRQVATYLVEVDLLRRRGAGGLVGALVDDDEGALLEHRVADVYQDLSYHAADARPHDVLHLHGFHHEQLRAGVHDIALAYIDAHDGALHGRDDLGAALG